MQVDGPVDFGFDVYFHGSPSVNNPLECFLTICFCECCGLVGIFGSLQQVQSAAEIDILKKEINRKLYQKPPLTNE